MAITTKESLSGFIASDPDLTFTSNGDARFYARVGQPHARRGEDGSFIQLEATFTDLVMFRKSAERAHAQFQKGDNFIAEGETRSYPQTVDGVEVEREQFVASRIGHDNNTTSYEVDRLPGRDAGRDAAQRESAGRDPIAAAMADRAAQLDSGPSGGAASAAGGPIPIIR